VADFNIVCESITASDQDTFSTFNDLLAECDLFVLSLVEVSQPATIQDVSELWGYMLLGAVGAYTIRLLAGAIRSK